MIKEQELKDYIQSSPNSIQYLLEQIKKQVDKKEFNTAAKFVQQLHSNIIGLTICEEFLTK